MSFPKLKINLSDLKPLDFTPSIQKPPKPQVKFPKIYIYIPVLVFVFVFAMYRPQKRQLRRIIRMKCSESKQTQVCTSSSVGEYVLDIGQCNTYDFNGIPITDIFKHGTQFRIPFSPTMSLKLSPPCPGIVATVDTRKIIPYGHRFTRRDPFSSFNGRMVWITDSCYTEFSLTIGNEVIFHQTPYNMIEHVQYTNFTAYSYEASLTGNIMLSGNCDQPIHIYT